MEHVTDTFSTYIPEGFHNMNAYLIAPQAEKLIQFLKKAFYAEEKNRSTDPESGRIVNVILQIGDTAFMVSDSTDQIQASQSSFYVFVNDVDAVHQHAVGCGAESIMAPADMHYGDRNAGVKDYAGNNWWIATRFEHNAYED